MPPLDDEGLRRLDALIEQRLIGVPLAHLSGRQQFMGLEMLAGKAALVSPARIPTQSVPADA